MPVAPSHADDGKDDVALIVDEVIARMPRQRRAMVILVYEHDLAIRDAAAALGIAYETGRTHFKLAHVWLRKHLPVALQGYQLGRGGSRELAAGAAEGAREEEVSNE